jgi:hypothetical protein
MELGLPTVTPFGAIPSPITSGELPDPAQVLLQGEKQAALQGAGKMLSAGATKISKPIMELAVKATPEVAQTAIREGIKTTQAGFSKLMTKLGQYGSRTANIARQASRTTPPFPIFILAQQAYDDALSKVQTSMTGEEKLALEESFKKFLGQNPRAVGTALKLHQLKQAADVAARAIYKLPEGVSPTPAQKAVEGFYKAFADRARAALNQGVRGYEDSNEPAEALIKLKDALRPLTKKEMSTAARVIHSATSPFGRAAAGAVIGGASSENRTAGALGGAAIGASLDPATIALGLNSPLIQFLLRRIPGAANSAIPQQ